MLMTVNSYYKEDDVLTRYKLAMIYENTKTSQGVVGPNGPPGPIGKAGPAVRKTIFIF